MTVTRRQAPDPLDLLCVINGTLDFSQYMVNPYFFEITEEPAEDPDPNAADSIAGFELHDPLGNRLYTIRITQLPYFFI